MNKDKRNNIKLLGTLNNADESGIIANANQIYDANEDKSTQDVSKEHTERIKTLETKEDAMQTTLENITKTGEASAASNVTYNHSDSKLDATNVQQAVDEVRKRSNYNDGDNIIDFNTIHLITDNPEFVIAAVDVNDRILYGIKTDGQPYFGVGCPQRIKDAINAAVGNVLFDISAYHATGGTLATYDNLEDALGTNGENIPQSLKKGGMSVKFVQTSDNKYVQWRLMSDSFNTTVTNWQGVDDEPTAGSDNLVKSGSIILNKNYYRSILASNLGYYSDIINKFIKELWISPNVPFDIDKLCIGNIRKRYNSSQWGINFYNSQTPSDITSYEYFESIKKSDSLELIVGFHGSYCLVDWSAIDDGQVMGVIDPIYCLDVNYVTDIDNFPIIKAFKEHGILNPNITDIKNLSNTGLPYVKRLTLNGLTSNDNLNLRIAISSSINFQIYQGSTMLCWASFGKTEYEDYYLITSSSLNNLPLGEYRSSGVTGTISLYTNKILKSDNDKRFPFTYPFGDDYPLLDAIRNALTNDDLKSRKNFWKLPLKNQTDLYKQVNLAIREIYLIKQNGSAIDENNIVLGDIRKNFGSGNDCCIAFFVGGENPPHRVLNFNSTSANATGVKIIKSTNNDFTGYVLVDWDAIPTSRAIASVNTEYLIDWNTVSNIANSPTLYSYLNLSKSHKEIVIEKLNTPDISWVDDDFQLDSVLRIKNLGLQLGFRSDFGLIPRATGGTGEYPTDFTFSFTSEQLAVIKEVENAGFHCEHHPVHRGWYSSESAGTYQGRQYIEYLLCSGMRLFKEDNILDSNCVIYPGGSGSNDEAVEMCRSHVKYGIAASGPDANVGSVDPMTLGRLFISTISQSLTKTYWKNKILKAFNTGGWIILGTHGHMFDNSGTVDETTPSFANLAEIIEYANTLSTIKPVSEVYRKRKPMLDLYKV